jgi:hypothetical protein
MRSDISDAKEEPLDTCEYEPRCRESISATRRLSQSYCMFPEYL